MAGDQHNDKLDGQLDSQLNYDDLLSRLEDAEELVKTLLASEAGAMVSTRGVHVLRLRNTDQALQATDRALQAAKKGLEEIVARKTWELRTENEELRREIEERKKTQDEPCRSQERLRRLYESEMMGVFNFNFEGQILDSNDKFLQMIGRSRAEIEAGTVRWDEITPPEFRVSDLETHALLKAVGVSSTYEKAYMRKDGTRVPVLISSATVGEGRNEGIAVVIDISERKRAEAALIKSEKLGSVGRMAATVAHEINNPLELILNCVYIASLDKNLSDQAKDCLGKAEEELSRVAHLTRQTLGFYRESIAPSTVDLSKIVQEVLDLYMPKLKQRGIEAEAAHRGRFHVHAVSGEIRQVVSNIITNAMDASSAGSRIRIRTNCITLNGSSWIRMTFADMGRGIQRENLAHIFEPFFTTKESVGIGLGLWVTGEIVRRHQGKLRVRSRPGRGTVFSVMFPEASNSNNPKEGEPLVSADSGCGR